ncbi:MAG: enoyl-CoA hydratase [Gammaproteobacteria bacterium]|nr:enoyl-CoA hydratase [Gammaproteobacteria bacterium]
MTVLLETLDRGIATLTMNRPEARNAMSGEMIAALLEALPRLGADNSVRCVVLTGAGGAFCAGGDVKGFAAGGGGGTPPTLEQRAQTLRPGFEVARLLHELPKPTLAAIPGAAAGAGLSLALACDLRIAVDSAKMTTAFAKVGLSGDYGMSYFLPLLVGQSKARELLFSAPLVTGVEALALGLINRAVSADDYEAAVQAWATELSQGATVAIGYMKKNLNSAATSTLSELLDREAAHMARCFTTQDHKQAVQAFVAKEAPLFAGE